MSSRNGGGDELQVCVCVWIAHLLSALCDIVSTGLCWRPRHAAQHRQWVSLNAQFGWAEINPLVCGFSLDDISQQFLKGWWRSPAFRRHDLDVWQLHVGCWHVFGECGLSCPIHKRKSAGNDALFKGSIWAIRRTNGKNMPRSMCSSSHTRSMG